MLVIIINMPLATFISIGNQLWDRLDALEGGPASMQLSALCLQDCMLLPRIFMPTAKPCLGEMW